MFNNNEDIDINNPEMINNEEEQDENENEMENENENENFEESENDNNNNFYGTNNFDYSKSQNLPLNFDYKSRTNPDFTRFNEQNNNHNFSQSDINFENTN